VLETAKTAIQATCVAADAVDAVGVTPSANVECGAILALLLAIFDHIYASLELHDKFVEFFT